MTQKQSLITECVQQLKASKHAYENLLGSSVESVWIAVGLAVSNQIRSGRGASVPTLGKFSFVRDLFPLRPVFLLADHFANCYGVNWHRPPPALLTPSTDINLSVVGSEAGCIPKDQAAKTLDVLVAFIGKKLQKGEARGRLDLGNIGEFVFEGRTLSFRFKSSFINSIQCLHGANNSHNTINPITISTNTSSLPRALSMERLKSVDRSKSSIAALSLDHTVNTHHQRREVSENELRLRRDQEDSKGELSKIPDPPRARSKSSSQIPIACRTIRPQEGKSMGQILPRFMLPDPSPSPSKLVYEQQAVSMQSTFEFKLDEHQARSKSIARQDEEIERRTKATRLHSVQERAEKIVDQRDLDSILQEQIELKQREITQAQALAEASVNFDAIRVLPRGPVVTDEQRRLAKDKLRGRLHDQVSLKQSLAHHRLAVERAESAFFLSKVEEQAERERQHSEELKLIAREALVKGWKQQQAIRQGGL